ncbi:MAG TPA: pilus assembly protein [Kineosporiaceae bacterium]|nr:pilus assembly protein [Kineosporiaceae bacterium]
MKRLRGVVGRSSVPGKRLRAPGRCARNAVTGIPGPAVGPGGRHDDRGSAVVEFVTLGVLLLVPVVYLVLTLGRIQAAAFATDAAAREAARTFTTAQDEATGRVRAFAAVRLGLLDQGFETDPVAAVRIVCRQTPCLVPEGRVAVEVSVDVVLPGVPGIVDRIVPTHVTVRSTQIGVVDAFRSRGAP